MEIVREVKLKRSDFEGLAAYAIIHENNEQKILAYSDSLSNAESKYYEALKYRNRQKTFLSGRMAAKKALSYHRRDLTLKEISIDHGVFGQPVVRCPVHMGVSISHSENIAFACSFPIEHPMGVDIEVIKADRAKTIQEFITNQEKIIINKLSHETSIQLLILWTMKEALSKVLKTGLMVDLGIYELEQIDCEKNMIIGLYKYFKQYKVITIVEECYVYSVALPKNTICSL